MKCYAKLGALIGDFPEAGILRRFSAPSAQNLLRLELRKLEVDLWNYAYEDDTSQYPDCQAYSLDWWTLKESMEDGSDEGNDGRKWRTIVKTREKLKEYRK
jgi:hypothetical protein